MRIVEHYDTPDGRAVRFWALEPRLLVGGTILGPVDGEHLKRSYGVTHVLSVESEHDDEGKGFQPDVRERWAFPDSGSPKGAPWTEPGAIPVSNVEACIRFARRVLEQPHTVLYLHCMMGGARSPCIAYAVLVHMGFDCDDVRRELVKCGANLRPIYIASIEHVLGGLVA